MPKVNPTPLPLSAADLENLRESGLTEATIRLARLRTEGGALVFPYFDLDGTVNCFARRRPHNGKPAKYVQPPGSPVRAYRAPATLAKLRDCKSDVYITEGEKKALALSQLGFASVGLGGFWSAYQPGTKELIEDLASIVWAGRTVYIVFDNDAKPQTRRDAEAARRRLAGVLRRAGAKAHQVYLPGGADKQGVDDFIVARGADAFRVLVERTKSKANESRFTAAQLMEMDLPEPLCIIPGIIAEGLNLLVSRPKMGKSWMAFAICIAIARGGTVLGNVQVEQGDVLYLALEDNRRRLKNRLAKLLAGEAAPESLTLWTICPRMDEGGVEEMQKWIDAADDPKLIVVDTLAKIKKRGTKQGDRYAEDYEDVGQLKALADDNDLSIIVNHHVRKMQGDDILDEVSGTIGITGAADTILILKRERGQHDACLHVTGRDVDEREIGLKWDAQSCQWSIMGLADTLRMSAKRQMILDTLRAEGPASPKELAAILEWEENNVKQLLFKMRKDGQVKSNSGKYEACNDNPDNPVTEPGEDER
ncbi:MAG: DUF3854 domain-containing protein [Gemmataceae bacterium]|nr:DUF3854 domain-containing protein [Gemmataceae bacterium]MCI0738685.1 DUF3854 domain-containing protein [Gemmataceae bacterium]